MQSIEETKYEIDTLSKLFEIIDQFCSSQRIDSTQTEMDRPKKWIFRGQGNYSDSLLPAIGRLVKIPGYTAEKILLAEQLSFSELKILSYNLLKDGNDFIKLAIAQHHGLKTRLLDWTFSPLVALFFAVENENYHNCDGGFYVYRPKSFVNIINLKFSPFEVKGEASKYQFLLPPPITERINVQNGVFQWFKFPTDELTQLDGLIRFKIKSGFKSNLKADLFNMGISYKTLFPDLDGLAKHLNHIYFNENYFKP